jgi:D-amino peptidase
VTKLYVSVDIEGVAGVVHWDQVMPGAPAYPEGRRLLVEELNALCRGALAAGVETIVVNDAHSSMRNIVPDELPARVRTVTGHFKPMYMMEGLDESFDAAVFLAYHGPAGSASVLSHTYNPRVIWEARLDGEVTGETGINAMVARHYGVPVILVTGDDVTIADAKRWIPEATGVTVKRSIGRFAADSMTPEASRAEISAAIQTSLRSTPAKEPSNERRHRLQLTLQSAEMATIAEWVGATRIGDRVITIEGHSGLEVYRRFHTTLLTARTVAET